MRFHIMKKIAAVSLSAMLCSGAVITDAPAAYAAGRGAVLYREIYGCNFENEETLRTKALKAYENISEDAQYGPATDADPTRNVIWRVRKTSQDVGVVAADIDIGDSVKFDGSKYIVSMDLKSETVPGNDHYISIKASSDTITDESCIIGAHGQAGLHLSAINADEQTMYCSYAENIADGDWWSEYLAAKNSQVTVQVGEWFNLTIEIDTKNNAVKYYYNGVYAGGKGSANVGDAFKNGIKTIQIQSWQGWNDYVELYIDNISVLKECGTAGGFSGIDRVLLSSGLKSVALEASQSLESITNVLLYNESKSCDMRADFTAVGNRVVINPGYTVSNLDVYSISMTDTSGSNIFGSFVADTSVGRLSVSTVNVYDSAGNIVTGTPPANTSLKAKAKILNSNGVSGSADLIAAAYKDGRLENVSIKTVTASTPLTEDELEIDTGDADSIKTFVWDSVSGCVPLPVEAPYTNPEIFRIEMPFDDSAADGGFTQITNQCSRADNADGGGLFLYPGGTNGTSSAVKAFGRNVSTDILHISFDYKAEEYQNKFWARLGGTGNPIQFFYDGGTIAYFNDVTAWTISDGRAEYTPGTWTREDIYVDLTGRVMYCFNNGVLYGRAWIPRGVTKLNRIELVNEGSYGDISLDNLVIRQTTAEDVTLPKELNENAFAEITSDNTGRIYFGKTGSEFNVLVGNKTAKSSQYIVKWSLSGGNGVVDSGESAVTIAARSSQTVRITGDTGGYGYFILRAKVYDADGELVCEASDYKFSAANVPEDGLQDPTMGIQIKTNEELDRNGRNLDMALMKKLGFSYTRGGLGFSAMNEQGTVIMDEWTRAWYEMCRDSGIDIINILSFGNTKITSENPPRSEYALNMFAEYALQYCALHKEVYGYAPKDLDVWNEYWMEGNVFNPDRATPEDYANMLKAVYTKVKPQYPETRIWGLSGVNTEHYAWVERVLKAGGGDYMDGYTLHPYYNTSTPEEADFKNVADTYKALFNQYGYYNKPVWISEWGWASVGENGYPNEEEQAAYFVRANIFNKVYSLADMTEWYCSNDVGNNNEQELRFGMLRGAYRKIGYEAKPVYLSAANYQSLMIGSSFVKSEQLSTGVTAYTFSLRDGRKAVILWSVTGTETVTLSVNTGSLLMIDMYGNEKTVAGSGGSYTINCSKTPCYLVGNWE